MSSKQEEVYRLLIAPHYLTPTTIARRLGNTRQAVDKLIRQLRRKGFINREYVPSVNGGVLAGYGANLRYRMHAIELNIAIIQRSDRYWRKLSSGDVMIDGNRCKLYKKKIKVYCGRSFFGASPEEAVAESAPYIGRLLRRMEDEFGCILNKKRSQNVRMAKAHLADIVNEIAEIILRDGDSLQVRGADGKVWLLIDGSWKFREMETVDPKKHCHHMKTIGDFLDDLKEHPTTISKLQRQIDDLRKEMVKKTRKHSCESQSMLLEWM